MKQKDRRRLNAVLKRVGAKSYITRMAGILADVRGVDYAIGYVRQLQAKGLTDKPSSGSRSQ